MKIMCDVLDKQIMTCLCPPSRIVIALMRKHAVQIMLTSMSRYDDDYDDTNPIFDGRCVNGYLEIIGCGNIHCAIFRWTNEVCLFVLS